MNAPVASATEYRLTAVERAIGEMGRATDKIADALEAIARLEERHSETREAIGRAFREVADMKRDASDARLALESLKGQIAPLQESRRWMIAGMLGVVGLVGAAVIGLVLIGK